MAGFNVLNFGNNSRNKRCSQYLKFSAKLSKDQNTLGSLVGKREGQIKYKQLRILAGNLCLKGRLSTPLKEKRGSSAEGGDLS